MEALTQCRVAHYFFVARIVIILGVALLCFSSKQLSARQGRWIWQRSKAEHQTDYTVEPAESVKLKKTRIKKRVSENGERVREQTVEEETVVSQEIQAEPVAPSQEAVQRARAALTPTAEFGNPDSYWDMLLNPRPWWDLSGQNFGLRR